mmetsp:Transcript_2865/g.4474  ORF Transcript_2865/g.4474 Transcript_2865/m.4474 type:complete len:420 (-) Transcript_2865:33-1292(-)
MTRTTITTSSATTLVCSLSLFLCCPLLSNGFGNVNTIRRIRSRGDTFPKTLFLDGQTSSSCRRSPRSVCYNSWSPFSSTTDEETTAAAGGANKSTSRNNNNNNNNNIGDNNDNKNKKRDFSSWSTLSSSSQDKTGQWNIPPSSSPSSSSEYQSSSSSTDIEDLERWLGKEGDGWERTVLPLGIFAVLAVGAGVVSPHIDINVPTSITDATQSVEHFVADPNAVLQNVVQRVEDMGPLGPLYFGVAYTIAEILAIPAIPLTASAGYLFGVTEGTAVVLLSASIAAAISFVIGRTLLRSYVEGILEDQPRMKKIDKAIGKEGFKLMLLLRLSPIFPFALSNYLYGATSVRFWPYFFGTMLGFTPGTIAYVYTGEVGKALTAGQDSAEPWYIYVGGFALLLGFIKVASDTATGIIEGLEEED